MKFVFLIYVARSGSTLFARHLDAISPDLLVTPEWNALIAALRAGEARVREWDGAALLRILRLDRQIANLELDPAQLAEIAARCAGAGTRALVEALTAAHAARRGREPRVVAIKNSASLWVAEQVIEVFPEALFVHVERDGRAVVNSLIHTESDYDPGHPMGRGDPLHCARIWTDYLERLDAFAARRPERVLNVRYEEFLARPEATLAELRAELATRLGVELRPGAGAGRFAVPAGERGLHALVEKPPQAARADGWKSELARSAGIAVEVIQREQLRARGYPEHFLAGVRPAEIARARATEYARHVGATLRHGARRASALARIALEDRARAGAVLREALWERLRARF
jgi:hypothetical protein